MSIVTIFGATGNQGGSVASTILSSPELKQKYKVRAITRDPSKASAQALAFAGAELVQADLNNASSLQKAVEGSYAVFAITDFWSLMSKDAEVKQGRNIAKAAFAAGVKHLIWSSLPHATKLTAGKLTGIPHFDSKAEVEEYIEEKKLGTGTKASYFMPGTFMSNLGTMINPGQDGVPTIAGPLDPETGRYPWIDIRADTGKYVVGILEAGPEKADGARVQAVGEWLNPNETVRKLSEQEGKTINFASVPSEVYKGFLPPAIAEELTQTMELMGQYHYYGVGAEKYQEENDKWLLKGSSKVGLKEYAEKNGPLVKG